MWTKTTTLLYQDSSSYIQVYTKEQQKITPWMINFFYQCLYSNFLFYQDVKIIWSHFQKHCTWFIIPLLLWKLSLLQTSINTLPIPFLLCRDELKTYSCISMSSVIITCKHVTYFDILNVPVGASIFMWAYSLYKPFLLVFFRCFINCCTVIPVTSFI